MPTFREMASQMKIWIDEARQQLDLFGTPIWGATDPHTDEEHIQAFKEHLEMTRKRFDLPEKTQMHALRLEDSGSSFITCLTGNTQNAGNRARALAGILLSMPAILETIEIGCTEVDKVADLIEQNARQSEEIKKLNETIVWLAAKSGVEYVAPHTDAA